MIAARKAGAFGRLEGGGDAWIRRGDLQASLRMRAPRDLVGETVQGLAIGPADVSRPGELRVSPRHLAIERFHSALDADEPVKGVVVRANRGGVTVDVDGCEAFVPRSHLRGRDNRDHESLIGEPWRGWVLKVTAGDQLLTAYPPRRRARRARQRARFARRLRVGDVRRGWIRNVTATCLFVRLHRAGVDAVVPSHTLVLAGRDLTDEPPQEGEGVRVEIAKIGPGTKAREVSIVASYLRRSAIIARARQLAYRWA